MRRSLLFMILAAAGCAEGPDGKTREEDSLDRLRARTNAYKTFRALYELTDGKDKVPIELAFRAPDRAILRYGSGTTVLLAEGVGYFYVQKTCFEVNYVEEIARLRETFGSLLPGDPPEIVFGLGDWEKVLHGRGLRATVGYGRLGARLAWLDELRGAAAGDRLYRRGEVEIELREDGFIERAAIGASGRLRLLEISIDEALDETVFITPPREGLQDVTARARESAVRALEDELHRWVLQGSLEDATLEALVRRDLTRRYEPEKMATLLRGSLEESVAEQKKQNPGAPPAALRARLEIERGKALGSVEIMEREIQDQFARDLRRYFEGMPAPPPARLAADAARRWQAAVARQVDLLIRRPLAEAFEERLRE